MTWSMPLEIGRGGPLHLVHQAKIDNTYVAVCGEVPHRIVEPRSALDQNTSWVIVEIPPEKILLEQIV